jgi:hypothetical protein
VVRGIKVCRRSALIQREAGVQAAVGQRHFDAPRLASDPANVQVPCWQRGGLWRPFATFTVIFSGITGRMPRSSHAA